MAALLPVLLLLLPLLAPNMIHYPPAALHPSSSSKPSTSPFNMIHNATAMKAVNITIPVTDYHQDALSLSHHRFHQCSDNLPTIGKHWKPPTKLFDRTVGNSPLVQKKGGV